LGATLLVENAPGQTDEETQDVAESSSRSQSLETDSATVCAVKRCVPELVVSFELRFGEDG
jgi:hypothetical protein